VRLHVSKVGEDGTIGLLPQKRQQSGGKQSASNLAILVAACQEAPSITQATH
jgi:hypothetical protein